MLYRQGGKTFFFPDVRKRCYGVKIYLCIQFHKMMGYRDKFFCAISDFQSV